MSTLTYSGQLTTTTCWCGIHYAVPSEFYEMIQRQHRDGRQQTKIFCPLGHTWEFSGEGEAERLRKRLAEEQRRTQAARDLLHAEERSHAATRGVVTKKRKQLARVANGVCPCCNRSFQNLTRHMQGQHPEYKPLKQTDEEAAA